jgi:hypothetical protein
MEIQNKLMETNRILNQVRAKLQVADREKRRGELTLKELVDVPDTTNTYKLTGTSFRICINNK